MSKFFSRLKYRYSRRVLSLSLLKRIQPVFPKCRCSGRASSLVTQNCPKYQYSQRVLSLVRHDSASLSQVSMHLKSLVPGYTKLNRSAPSIDTLKESRPWLLNTASLSQVSMLWKSLIPGYTKLNHSAPSIDTLKESCP